MKAKKVPDLSEYKDHWVALSENGKKVIASHKNIKKALAEAQKVGVENPIMVNASAFSGSYIL